MWRFSLGYTSNLGANKIVYYMENDKFKVDLSKMRKNRKNGVSGLMRVRNDAEFVVHSIESCIAALDELIIVYNGCTDNTPKLVRQMRDKYPDKIRVYEYTPKILGINLAKDEYVKVKALPIDSENLLSNYNNFALSKSHYKYVLKIDADQIYFTDKLKMLCDGYRSDKKTRITFREWLGFIIVVLSFVKSKIRVLCKINLNIDIDNYYTLYTDCIFKLVNNYKLSVSLSGINTVYNRQWFVTLGKYGLPLNILPPFNGVGDTVVFKVRKRTRFVPYDCKEYGVLASSKYSYIEKLVGVSRAFPVGFFWFHLNGMRKNIYKEQLSNLEMYPKSFMPIKKFICTKFDDISDSIPSEFSASQSRKTFSFLHNGEISKTPIQILEKLPSLV